MRLIAEGILRRNRKFFYEHYISERHFTLLQEGQEATFGSGQETGGFGRISSSNSELIDTENIVRAENEFTTSFYIHKGIRQEGVLSLLLFIAIMRDISRIPSKSTKVGTNRIQQVLAK